MGWSSCKQSKSEAVAEVLKDHNSGHYRVRKHALRGSQLWMIIDVLNDDSSVKESFISLSLFEKFGPGEIGHKEMSEHVHPYYYNVPLQWFQEVPVPRNADGEVNAGALGWRAEAVVQAQKKAGIKNYKPGDKLLLPEGFKNRSIQLLYKVKSSWVAKGDNGVFRYSPSRLLGAVLAPANPQQ